jgi:ApbE superfamily uncharacterized protein (UPF0280 family)
VNGPQFAWLPDGRLHLHHGPIDLIIECFGRQAQAAYSAVRLRFDGLLEDLVVELPSLRCQTTDRKLVGTIAQRMQSATSPFSPAFITPMAAVAGAVADEILSVVAQHDLSRAYVNNGGDIALYLGAGETFTAAMPHGRIRLAAAQPVRGVATSGWRGRSWSFGIADSVTVLAQTAAAADAAATMIANAVDLPGHLSIERTPANDLSPDSDLGARAVTTAVGPLSNSETLSALTAGAVYADELVARGLIHAAALTLNNEHRLTGALTSANFKELDHA